MHVLAVLEAKGAQSSPSPSPASDGEDTPNPVQCSPLTFAISEATASATIREMSRHDRPVLSPIRPPWTLQTLTPVKKSGASGMRGAAAAAGVPVTVAADMNLVTAPAAELRCWVSVQCASGRFQEYGCLGSASAAPQRS